MMWLSRSSRTSPHSLQGRGPLGLCFAMTNPSAWRHRRQTARPVRTPPTIPSDAADAIRARRRESPPSWAGFGGARQRSPGCPGLQAGVRCRGLGLEVQGQWVSVPPEAAEPPIWGDSRHAQAGARSSSLRFGCTRLGLGRRGARRTASTPPSMAGRESGETRGGHPPLLSIRITDPHTPGTLDRESHSAARASSSSRCASFITLCFASPKSISVFSL